MRQWKLKYDRPAERWTEALPLGNGTIGAMVYGGTIEERIALNLDTLWSGCGREKGNPGKADWEKIRKLLFLRRHKEAEDLIQRDVLGDWTESYLPAGDLWIKLKAQEEEEGEYLRELKLNEGLYQNSFTLGNNTLEKEIFTSMEDNLLVLSLRSTRGVPFDAQLTLTSSLVHEIKKGEEPETLVLFGQAPSYAAPVYYSCENPVRYEQKGLSFCFLLSLCGEQGEIYEKEGSLQIKGETKLTLYLTGGTNFTVDEEDYIGKDEGWIKVLKEAIQSGERKGFACLKKEHIFKHRSYFERMELELGEKENGQKTTTTERLIDYGENEQDQDLAALMFHYGRYLLIASSAPGSQCANLQGIWNHRLRAPWSSNYTVNINTEMNYWMAESCNLSEFHTPLFELIERVEKRGRKTAESLYQLEGWVSHHNVDLWGHSTPVGYYGQDSLPSVYSMWNMSSAWLCRHLWEHYQYTLDKEFLEKRAYPIIEGAVKFYLGYLCPFEGYLVTAPSTSPENLFLDHKGEAHAVTVASTMDISILRELFANYIRICFILQKEGMKKEAENALEKLPPYRLGKYGQLQEWYWDDEEAEVNHRHVSHLYGLYPSDTIRDEQLKKGCEITLNRRGDQGTGWCLAWKACLYARLGNGDRALELLNHQLGLTHEEEISTKGGGTYSNLFCAHPPFQIDGNFGYTAAVAEMLMQSSEGKIVILPAIPEKWQKGRVKGMKAKGGFTVDFSWENGRVNNLKIMAKEKCRLMVVCNQKEETISFFEQNVWIANEHGFYQSMQE